MFSAFLVEAYFSWSKKNSWLSECCGATGTKLVHNSCLCEQISSFFFQCFWQCFYWLLDVFCILVWSIILKTQNFFAFRMLWGAVQSSCIILKKQISWLSECFLGSAKLVGSSCLCEQISFSFSMFLAITLLTACCFMHFRLRPTSLGSTFLSLQNVVSQWRIWAHS